MTEIVFLVEGINPNGSVYTATDKIKEISPNWQPNLYDKHKAYYQKYTGDKIKFAPMHEVTSYDPNKRYFYFVPMNDWHCTAQQYIFMVSKEKQLEFAQNRVGFYFCQDFEMYPNLNFPFFGNYLAWVRLVRDAHSFPHIPIYFSMCAELEPKQKFALRRAFGAEVCFVNNPLITVFTRDELINKFESRGVSLDQERVMRDYFSTPKKKSYMALTRDAKFSRITMMHGLRALGLLDDGYVSNLMPQRFGSEAVAANKSTYANKVLFDMNNGGPMPYMEVDELDDQLIPGIYHGIGGDIPFDHMSTSCYDLVQETSTRYDVLDSVVDMAVITEKVLKSIIFGRPFMVNGGPRCLKVLARWGFSTSGFLFDESYDDREHFIDRQEGIAMNVYRYKNKYDEIMKLASDNRKYLEHNCQHVMNFPLEDVMIDAIVNPWL